MNFRLTIALAATFGAGALSGYLLAQNDSGSKLHAANTSVERAIQPPQALLREIEREEPGFTRMRSIYERVAALSIDECSGLMRAIIQTDHSASRTALLEVLIEKIVEFEPREAGHFLRTALSHGDPAFETLYTHWYRIWLDADHFSAIAHARASQDAARRDRMLQLAIDWVGAQSALARELRTELTEEARSASIAARSNQVSALSAFVSALRETDTQGRFQALRDSFSRLIQADARYALTQIAMIPETDRDAIVSAALGAWATDAPDAGFEYLSQAGIAPYRDTLLSALAVREPKRALAWIETHSSELGEAESLGVTRAVILTVLQQDGDTAARAVERLGTRASIDVIQQVAAKRASRDPAEAFDWATSLQYESEYRRTEALRAVATSVASTNPDQATTLLNRTEDAHLKRELMREVANRKAQGSVLDAWEWLQRYRDDPSYRENARALLRAWSYAKPSEVASVIATINDGEFQRATAEQLAQVWKERDVASLRTWIAQLPAGTLREALSREFGA